MKYLEFTFHTQPATETVHDVLAAVLAEAGFDSFDPSADAVKAYVRADGYDEALLRRALADFPLPDVDIRYESREAEDRDWNSEWEQNYFEPLVVDGRCVVHSTFHRNVPPMEYDITIDPRMSFGTGHHATTRGIMRYLLDMDLRGLRVLDMGCGTSILAILAALRGAGECLAVDNDEWCVKNSRENLLLNHVDNVRVELGDASVLDREGQFGLIIANINRNILLSDMQHYVPHLSVGGHLLMSGFYETDIAAIRAEAERLGLSYVDSRAEADWAAVRFVKPNDNQTKP